MAVYDHSYKPKIGCLQKFTSCRWKLAFMLCFLRACQTALRQSIGMALVCMAERPYIHILSEPVHDDKINHSGSVVWNRSQGDMFDMKNDTIGLYHIRRLNDSAEITGDSRLPDNTTLLPHTVHLDKREFEWDATFEGIVLSSYYYGYLLTPMLSCYIERFVGAKHLVATCVGLGALVNLLTPELTRLHRYLLVALRVVAGTTMA
uniref:Major facilitator superfamily (MFS) profile domain-containing protein n=1 Tax=Arion vulgaris TaxID=1028688 RepID=A0A0B7AIC2_9EUPU